MDSERSRNGVDNRVNLWQDEVVRPTESQLAKASQNALIKITAPSDPSDREAACLLCYGEGMTKSESARSCYGEHGQDPPEAKIAEAPSRRTLRRPRFGCAAGAVNDCDRGRGRVNLRTAPVGAGEAALLLQQGARACEREGCQDRDLRGAMLCAKPRATAELQLDQVRKITRLGCGTSDGRY